MKKLLRSLSSFFYAIFTNKPITTRVKFLGSIHYERGALEIGPFTNPGLRGPKVRYFDVLDKKGLLARSQVENYAIADPDNVPDIEYVSPTGDLSIIRNRFEAVYSAHCIEHQPDLIGHLKQVEQLLEPGGCYYLVIPDKRYCFDALIAEDDLAQVIEAHHYQFRVHTLANVIRYYALTTHNSPSRHWLFWHGSSTRVVEGTKLALEAYKKTDGNYIDVHAWRFTPIGFIRLINQLKELGYTQLSVKKLYETAPGTDEFYAVLAVNN